jgi:hypothetical protein
MKTFISLLVILPILAATSLKIIPQTNRQTYAEYAKENGIALAKSDLKAENQYLTCYDHYGQSGNSYRIQDYVSNLGSINWDNQFSSCCFYGIWSLFDGIDYNGRDEQVIRPTSVLSMGRLNKTDTSNGIGSSTLIGISSSAPIGISSSKDTFCVNRNKFDTPISFAHTQFNVYKQ